MPAKNITASDKFIAIVSEHIGGAKYELVSSFEDLAKNVQARLVPELARIELYPIPSFFNEEIPALLWAAGYRSDGDDSEFDPEDPQTDHAEFALEEICKVARGEHSEYYADFCEDEQISAALSESARSK